MKEMRYERTCSKNQRAWGARRAASGEIQVPLVKTMNEYGNCAEIESGQEEEKRERRVEAELVRTAPWRGKGQRRCVSMCTRATANPMIEEKCERRVRQSGQGHGRGMMKEIRSEDEVAEQ